MAYKINWHTILGPWEVKYPVKFYDGGDTVTQAFEKHIQEIIRIYGLLNALDEGKLDIGDFEKAMNAHIQDSDPHPNLSHNTLRDIQGGTSSQRFHLTAAEHDDVVNMRSIIESMLPEPCNCEGGGGGGGGGEGDHNSLSGLEGGGNGHYYHLSEEQYNNLGSGGGSGGGLSASTGSSYIRFSNGFTVAWGRATAEEYSKSESLPVTFNGTPGLATTGSGGDGSMVSAYANGGTLTHQLVHYQTGENGRSTSLLFSYICVGFSS
ncbi:MAG: hypothetical protein IJR68_10700 [Fretibacterium sp.]|nr:hypothetical protein [Fretibacterium sp.]